VLESSQGSKSSNGASHLMGSISWGQIFGFKKEVDNGMRGEYALVGNG